MRAVCLLGVLLVMAAGASGRCRRFPAIETFDIDSYLGRWYLQYIYTNEATVPLSQCWSWLYFKDRNDKLRIQTSYVNSLTNRVTNYQNRLWMKNPSEPSIMRYKQNYFLYNRNEDYQVIATDYANFTIEYQCSGSNVLNRREAVWLMTREQYPHPFVLERAFAAMIQLRLNDVDMERAYQSCTVRETNRRSDAPRTFADWLTGGMTSRIQRRVQGKTLSGFINWLGL
ncbi:Apolipoprotein D [Amphibalanus amphitrite]|uniref:Apolipoprotein D n=1 Tax=Amphibalanus amphitrite TaxID=1232801 RepID=A0A6A4VNX7_AMPAM|nr:apolipoprotein D-like [Amphibalanus amphitrite]XP_043209216.1 apolipoprotein D-like [Amphibalanus amphitrite]KAF0291958.1 Apolipoprotein D [Amphibalanus amphitrite]